MVRQHQETNKDESDLRAGLGLKEQEVQDAETPARRAAFRRLVLSAYDYRCATTGWRIMLPNGTSLIEAAHIVPFSLSHNDDPRNGLALTPTYHAALDKGLIAPGPDPTWHISNTFDKRIPDHKPFIELEGQPVLYYGEEKYKPEPEYLKRRFEMLESTQ